MKTVLYCTALLMINSCFGTAPVTDRKANNGTSVSKAESTKPTTNLSAGGIEKGQDEDEQDDLTTTTTEEAQVNRDEIIWTRGYRVSEPTQGKRNTSDHVIVVMPGLPGLPGLPGNPGQASLHTRKSSEYQDYKNCRFNVSGNGVFLCNYTDDGVNENISTEESRRIPVYANQYYRNGGEESGAKSKLNSGQTFERQLNHTVNNSSNGDFILIRLVNTTSAADKDRYGKDIVIRPLKLDYHTTPSFYNRMTDTEVENGNNKSHLLLMKPTIRRPEGPQSRQLHMEAVAMELDDDTYTFPGIPVINIPPFQQIFGPGEPNIVIGQPGMPGKPGMPGTPGEAVISTTADNIENDIEVNPSVRDIPVSDAAAPFLPSSVVPGVIPPLLHAGTLPQTGTLPLMQNPYNPYTVPGAQSSSSYYGGYPGSSMSSQAMTGIGQGFPSYPGIIGSPSYPSGGFIPGINPMLPPTGYPSYPGIQQYPYPPGYPLPQYPYPGYPGGYPYTG